MRRLCSPVRLQRHLVKQKHKCRRNKRRCSRVNRQLLRGRQGTMRRRRTKTCSNERHGLAVFQGERRPGCYPKKACVCFIRLLSPTPMILNIHASRSGHCGLNDPARRGFCACASEKRFLRASDHHTTPTGPGPFWSAWRVESLF